MQSKCRELQHTNLVRFFGASMKPPTLCIVMELMMGSLADLLYGKLSKGVEKTLPPCGGRSLSVLQVIDHQIYAIDICLLMFVHLLTIERWVQGIAAGMQFLHAHSVIHRDLKSLNVLFNRQLEVKLCDFAFSKFRMGTGGTGSAGGGGSKSAAFESTVGTPAWMAPEARPPRLLGTRKCP